MKNINTLILTASLGLAAAPGAWADVLFDTTTDIYASSVRDYYGWAQSFKTGASAVTLDSVVLRMANAANNSGGFTVSLYSDTGGKPGTSLGPLAGSANPATAGEYPYTGTQSLSANTFYWVDAKLTGGGNGWYNWLKTAEFPLVGTSEGRSSHNGNTFESPYSDNQSMQVNVSGGGPSGVPDSGSSALLGLLGLGGLAAWQRRTRQAQ